MLILARPSISTYLARTLYENHIPAVVTDDLVLPMKPAIQSVTPAQFAADPKAAYQSLLLTSSENALSFLYETIPYDDRILKAKLFKDKAAFRRAISRKYPSYFFKELSVSELSSLDPGPLPFPLILKPSTGISSIGVIRVGSRAEWEQSVEFIQKDLANYQKNYSASVVEGQKVLLERYIEGREFAIDGYFNSQAEPVVLNLLEHLFLNDKDTSDRIYLTRKSLLEEQLPKIEKFLLEFGDIFDLKRFPFHLELRLTPSGELIPIELNPLRFSGLGTTEIAQYAYGINVYESFFKEKKPEWNKILNRQDDSIYSFMCADISTENFRKPNLKVLDRHLFKQFEEVLEYRLLDEEETSTFAVVFFRSTDLEEPKRFLAMDFNQFVE
jgi:hypothetical protein